MDHFANTQIWVHIFSISPNWWELTMMVME